MVHDELVRLQRYAELNLAALIRLLVHFDGALGLQRSAWVEAHLAAIGTREMARPATIASLVVQVEHMHLAVTGIALQDMRATDASPDKLLFGHPILAWRLAVVTCIALAVALMPFMATEHVRAQRTLAMLMWVGGVWVSDALPMFVTSLFVPPLLIFLGILADPATGQPMSALAAAPLVYGALFDHTVWLILGGCALGAAVTKYQLDRSVLAVILRRTGHRPSFFILAVMALGALLSGFVSNIIATVLCLALVLPVVRQLSRQSPFVRCLLLCLAFSCNIGGMLTPVSSPQNLAIVQYLNVQVTGYSISFIQWFAVGLPFAVAAVCLVWAALLLLLRPYDIASLPPLDAAGAAPAAWTRGHWAVLVLTLVTVSLWGSFSALRGVVGDMATIALLPMLVLFGLGLLSVADLHVFPWDAVVTVGGSNVLGLALRDSGLVELTSDALSVSLRGSTTWVVVLVLAALVVLVASVVPHSRAAAVLMPLVGPLAQQFGFVRYIVMAVALASSCAVALAPVSIPTLLVAGTLDAYGRRYLSASDFLKFGGVVTLLLLGLLMTWGFVLFAFVFGQ